MLQLLKDEGTAARRRIPIYLVDDTDGKTPETGITISAGDVKVSKNGGAEANHGGSLTELASGHYYYEATAGELDTFGYIGIRLTKTGVRTFFAIHQVVAFNPYDIVRLGLTSLPNVAAGANGGLPLQGAAIPNANAGANGGLPTVDAGNGVLLRAAAVQAIWDALTSALTTVGSIGKALVDLVGAYTTTRAAFLDKLNITGNVAGSAEVLALSNNTSTRLSIPDFFERPDSGSTAFVLDLYIYDADGNMEAPDGTPTITVVNEAGTDRSANLSAVTNPGTGRYRVTYTVSSAHAIEQLRFEWTIIEGSKTRLAGDTAWVVDTTAVDFTAADRTKLDTIHANVDVAVSTRAPASTALSTAQWTNGRATNLDNLDTTISSRAAGATALSTAQWTNGRATNLDNLDATISSRLSTATWSSLMSGITVLGNWLRAGFRKSAADATALAEINSGGGTYSELTDSQEAIRDRGDAAWTTGGGGGGGVIGPGSSTVTITITKEAGVPVADADVWITSDQAGTTVIAGTLQTNSNGQVIFMLDNGNTYYLWMQKDGITPIRGQSFIANDD